MHTQNKTTTIVPTIEYSELHTHVMSNENKNSPSKTPNKTHKNQAPTMHITKHQKTAHNMTDMCMHMHMLHMCMHMCMHMHMLHMCMCDE